MTNQLRWAGHLMRIKENGHPRGIPNAETGKTTEAWQIKTTTWEGHGPPRL